MQYGFQLLFYGDSIFETFRGTDQCQACREDIRSSCRGVPAVFSKHYGKWRTGVMAIGGDQVCAQSVLVSRAGLERRRLPGKAGGA